MIVTAGGSTTAPTAPGVYLYEHIHFEGRVLHLTQTAPELAPYAFDYLASSWRVVGDYSATLFSEVGLRGKRSTLGLLNGFALPPGPLSECPDVRMDPPLGIGVVPKPGCYGDVKNDEARSIGIGTSSTNPFANPLFWPRGYWQVLGGTLGVTAWRFGADGTVDRVSSSPAGDTRLSGRWYVTTWSVHYPTLPASLRFYKTVDAATGSAVPDESYAYQLIPGIPDVLRLRLSPTGWTNFEFRPDP